MTLALCNGRPAQSLPLMDRGFLYGDGLFETVRFHAGVAPLWERHRARLLRGCAQLGIPLNETVLERERQTFFALPDMPADGVFRLTVTRGAGGKGYAAGEGEPTRLFALSSLPTESPLTGVTLRACQWRLARQPALAGIKHLNRLDQVMARREWDDPAIVDGLLQDEQGHVIETTACNLFLRQGADWLTPSLEACGVRGVMREWLLDTGFPVLGADVTITPVTWMALQHADEVFICNSVRGVVPVAALHGLSVTWPVGEASLALARQIRAWWHD